MGSLILEDFRTELGLELNNRTGTTDPASINVTRLNRWLNFSYLHISQPAVFRHRELESVYDLTLATGDLDYPIDTTTVGFKITGVESVVYVASTTWNWTSRRNKLHIDNVSGFTRQVHVAGPRPGRYLIRGEEILVSPPPDASIAGNRVRLFVLREPTPLVNGEVTVFSAYWDEVILFGAKYRAFKALGELGWADDAKHEYGQLINELGGRDLLTVLDDKPAAGGLLIDTNPTGAGREGL